MKCSNSECAAPATPCHLNGGDYKKCEFWLKTNGTIETPAKRPKINKKSFVNWSGSALQIDELNSITQRSSPITIGIVGKVDAGKTTFLAMLFTLLQKGFGFNNYQFAGSQSLIGWDELYHRLKVYQTQVAFPDPTPTEYLRFFHLALRNDKGLLKDLLISDASGEGFTAWAVNREAPNGVNARAIYKTSCGFILFIDCKDLIARKGSARAEIIALAEMLRHDLQGRPVIAVWSKADEKENVNKLIIDALSSELTDMFVNFDQIDISNFPSDNPDALVHQNNLKVVDWLLDRIQHQQWPVCPQSGSSNNDIFLNYRGHE
jgi:hypothetical protein